MSINFEIDLGSSAFLASSYSISENLSFLITKLLTCFPVDQFSGVYCRQTYLKRWNQKFEGFIHGERAENVQYIIQTKFVLNFVLKRFRKRCIKLFKPLIH